MHIPFSAEPKLLNELFGRDISYIIPEYQRAYSWECIGKSDKNNQVNLMWDDLYNNFISQGDQSDYFFGSIVLIDKKNQTFEVIDGQQRLTTIVLLFVAIKSFLKEIKPTITNQDIQSFIDEAIILVTELIYNKKLIGAIPSEIKLKIENSAEFDYDTVFKNVVENKDTPQQIREAANKDQLSVIKRYQDNHDFFVENIKNSFYENEKFESDEVLKLNSYIEFLKSKVSVVRILAGNFNVAYHVFEILNNRGLPLSNKDLFRNFIIKEFYRQKETDPKKYQSLNPNQKWNDLEQDYEMSDDFIGRWVESYRAGQQKSSAFNDLMEIYKTFPENFKKTKIENFYDEIKRDLNYYTLITNNSISHPIIKAKINFIKNAPNIRYSMNFLMSLSKRFDGLEKNIEEIISFLKEYEIYIIDKLLYGRFNYGPIYRCISLLNSNDLKNAKEEFKKSYDIALIKSSLDEKIIENEVAKIFIAKYVWINESLTSGDLVTQNLDYNLSTLEHVIPQTPISQSNWTTDFTEDFKKSYTYKLGNMTLLTTKMNSAAKNLDFSTKKNSYLKTKLPTTVELAHLPKITPAFIIERHTKIVNTILADLGISEINNSSVV